MTRGATKGRSTPGKSDNRTFDVLALHLSGLRVNQDLQAERQLGFVVMRQDYVLRSGGQAGNKPAKQECRRDAAADLSDDEKRNVVGANARKRVAQ